MEKFFITNRKGQKISVLLEVHPQQRGLAFVMHGLGGFKEQPHLVAVSTVFAEAGYTVVRFDTTNTSGESDGAYEDATVTNYYQDLEDVLAWAATQQWYQEPFVLFGHSVGAMCVALYAQNHLEKIKALVPCATVISGTLSMQTKKFLETEKEWRATGWRITQSESKPGLVKRLRWSHMEDRLRYDLLLSVHKLTMPTLMIVGETDDATPPEHQKIFFNALPGPKELHIIPDAPHTFHDESHLAQLAHIVRFWIQKL